MDDLDQLTDEQLAGWKAQNQAVLDKAVLASPEKLDALSDEELAGLKSRQHEVLLAPFREQAAKGRGAYTIGEGPLEHIGRSFVSPIRSIGMNYAYGVAKERLAKGNAEDSDLRAIAAYEHEQGVDQQQPEWAKTAGAVAGATGSVGAVGLPILGPGVFAAQALTGASAQAGQAIWNPEVLLKGGATAAAQIGVLKALGPISSKLFPEAKGVLAEAGKHAATGTVGFAVADYGTKIAGLSEHGGAIQDIIEGRYGDAARNVLSNAIMTGGIGAVEGLRAGYSRKAAVEKAVEGVQSVAEQVTANPERRADAARRKAVSEMSPEEMQKELLTSKTVDLPNKRAFEEAGPAKAVAMSDADGLKAFNDKFGYEAGDSLLRAKAEALKAAGLEAFHDKGDEFLYRGGSPGEIGAKLERAREILKDSVIEVTLADGSVKRYKGADFSYGTGTDLSQAETGLKAHKSEREARGERARGELRGIAEVGPEADQIRPGGAGAERNGTSPPSRPAVDLSQAPTPAPGASRPRPAPSTEAPPAPSGPEASNAKTPPAADLKSAIHRTFTELMRESPADGMVKISDVREAVRREFGDKAASHEVLDEILWEMKRAKQLKWLSISDRSRATEKEVNGGVKGVGEQFFYLEHVEAPPAPEAPGASKAKSPANAPAAKMTAEELHRRLVNGEPIPGVSPEQADDLRKTILQGQSLEGAAQERGVSKQAVDQSVEKAAQRLHRQVEEPGEPAVAEEKGPRKPTRAEAKMAGLRIGPIGENSKIADIGKVDAAIDKLLTEKARLKKTGQLTQEKEAEINARKAELFQTRTAMGAAALGELVPPAGMFERPEFEALANEVVHAHRMSDQAAPVFKQATQADAQVWEDAAERIRLDPKAGSKLVEELNDKPRPMTSTEDIVLLREMAERRQRWRQLSEEVERLGSSEAADRAWEQLDQAYRDMTDADSAASKAGSEAGRAFRLRRLMMAEDYSPQGLLRRFQSKLGRPATPEEARELEKDAISVEEAQVKVGRASGEESSRRLDEADAAATKAIKEPTDKPRRRKEADSLIVAAADKARKAAGDDRALGTLAAKLFTAVAERGVQGRDNRLAAVHEILKGAIPDLTLDQTRELVVGRGESRPYTKDELHASIDKDKGELRQVDRLVGMSEGIPPQKYRGSVERYTPSQTERDLQRQVRQKARELGFDRYDAEGALKSRLASAKTRAENEIADLMREIQTGERRPAKAGIEPDAELKAKQNLVEILRNARNAAVPKPNEAPQDFLNRQIAAAERAAQAWQERAISAKAGVFPEKTAKAAPPEVQVIRDRADAWKAEYQTLKAIRDAKAAESEAAAKLEAAKQGKFEAREEPVQGPKTQAETTVADARERANQARAETRKLWLETPEGKKWQDELRNRQLQAHYADRVAKLREMLANDDFTKPPKREFQPNDLTIKAREDLARVQAEVDRRIEEKRLLTRGKWEKTRDFLVDLRRAFLLSNPVTTVVKIPAAAAEKIVFNTLEELTGAVWGYVPGIGRFAGKASVEGGFSPAGEKAAYTRGVRMGFKDFWQRLTKGASDVDVAYGKEDPEIQLRQSWLKMPGQIHGAEKAIPFRTDFERRAEKLFADARRKGVNIDEGGVQDRLLTEAYRKALDSQFGEDNRFIQRWQRYVGELNNSDVAHERLAGFLGKMLLPIVKVPTNIAAQTAEAVAGVPIGLTRAVYNGIRNGVANTSPEVANGIMRQLKRGSIGSALMAVGFAMPGAFGGYYQPREKRDEQDAKFGSVKIFGMNVPSVLLHNPALEALQFGATVRRVSDKHWSRRMGGEPKGISEGIMAATAGLAEEVPLVREMTQVDKLLNSDERHYAIGAEAKSFTVPGIVDWVARQMDKKTPFSPSEEPQKRKPEGVIQHIETGVPGLRQRVPAKK